MIKKPHCLFLMTIASTFVVSCQYLIPDNAFRAAPDTRLTANFTLECVNKFDFSKVSHTDGGRCDKLDECLRNNMRGTVLATYDAWPSVEKIIPYSGNFPSSIPEMRENANQSGAKAIKIFNLINEIHGQCLIDTGLD